MPLTTESVTPDPKKAADKPAEKTASTGKYLPAGESSDPAVHQLLAQRQTAVSNEDEDGVKDADRALNELGYE